MQRDNSSSDAEIRVKFTWTLNFIALWKHFYNIFIWILKFIQLILLVSESGVSPGSDPSHLQTKLKSLSCELSSLHSQGRLPSVSGSSPDSGTMVVRPSPDLRPSPPLKHQHGSAPSLHHSNHHSLQPGVFGGEMIMWSYTSKLNLEISTILVCGNDVYVRFKFIFWFWF